MNVHLLVTSEGLLIVVRGVTGQRRQVGDERLDVLVELFSDLIDTLRHANPRNDGAHLELRPRDDVRQPNHLPGNGRSWRLAPGCSANPCQQHTRLDST